MIHIIHESIITNNVSPYKDQGLFDYIELYQSVRTIVANALVNTGAVYMIIENNRMMLRKFFQTHPPNNLKV